MTTLALLLTLMSPSFGQTTDSVTILAGLPTTIVWSHPLDARTGDVSFQAWTDTAITKNWPLSELTITATATGFSYSAPHPAFTRGTKAFKVRAKNDGGFFDSPVLTLIVTSQPPVAPSLPNVIQAPKVGEP